MTNLAVLTRFSIQLFSMLFNFLKQAYKNFKWLLEFLIYHPFHSLRRRHHHRNHHNHHYHHQYQPLQEFEEFKEERVEIWHYSREGEGEEMEEVECTVCLNKISEGEEVRVLSCDHVFHRECLNQWVSLRNHTCPLCRGFLGSGIRLVIHGVGGRRQEIFHSLTSSSDLVINSETH